MNVPYFGVMDATMQLNWTKEVTNQSEVNVYKLPQPVGVECIVLTQNCDIHREKNLIVAKIKVKNDFSGNAKSRAKQINKIIRNETRSHYLPGSNKISKLQEPYIIDLKEIFTVPSKMILDNLDVYFIARLKDPAVKILQEKITRFFTRLAYDEEIFYTDEELKSRIKTGKSSIDDVKKALSQVNRHFDYIE